MNGSIIWKGMMVMMALSLAMTGCGGSPATPTANTPAASGNASPITAS